MLSHNKYNMQLPLYRSKQDIESKVKYITSHNLDQHSHSGVDLTDTWYRFALWLPGLHSCLAKLLIHAMPGCILCSSWITHSLPGGGTTTLAPQSTQLSSTLNCFFFFFEHNPTTSGKKTVAGVQVVTASKVQSIGCRWQAISSCPLQTVE